MRSRPLSLALLAWSALAGSACRWSPAAPATATVLRTGPAALQPGQGVPRDPYVPPVSEEAEFVARLAQHGVVVQYIAGSKAENVLGTRYPARWVRTDRGVVDVLFAGTGAAEPRVCEHVEGSRFVYTLTGGQVIDANRRLYFTAHDGIFAITDSRPLDQAIRQALGAAPAAC